VSAQTPRILVADVGERHEEVLTGPEVDVLSEQVEGHEERSLRNLLLLLDQSSHGRTSLLPFPLPN
jgi:hypothetical protein